MPDMPDSDSSASDGSSDEGVELLERDGEHDRDHDRDHDHAPTPDANDDPFHEGGKGDDDDDPIYTNLEVLEMAAGQTLGGPLCPEGSCDEVPRGLLSLCCCVLLLVLGLVVVQQAWFVSALSKVYGSIYGGPARATCARLQNETALFATRRPPLAAPSVDADADGPAAPPAAAHSGHANATRRHSPPPVLYTIPGSGSTWVRLLVVS